MSIKESRSEVEVLKEVEVPSWPKLSTNTLTPSSTLWSTGQNQPTSQPKGSDTPNQPTKTTQARHPLTMTRWCARCDSLSGGRNNNYEIHEEGRMFQMHCESEGTGSTRCTTTR
jgi:hypothetical protein